MSKTTPTSATSPRHLVIVAVEPSGDEIGAALHGALMARARHLGISLTISGCGGPQLASAGMNSLFPIGPLSVMGFTDVARAVPLARLYARQLADHVARVRAHGVIFVDGWAFSRLAAPLMHQGDARPKLYKYVAPQIWASRPQRIDFIKDWFDGVLTVLPFEKPLFDEKNIPVTYVGNPLFEKAVTAPIDAQHFRARRGLGHKPILAVLPGSREGEVRRLLPIFRETVSALRARAPDFCVVIPAAPAVADFLREETVSWAYCHIVTPDEKYDALHAATVALSASGTVTTEIALSGTPQIIAYKVDPLTHLWAQRVITTPYASILNVMADAPIIPEFIQDKCVPEPMAAALFPLLTDAQKRADQRAAVTPYLARLQLGGEPAASRAAHTVFDWLSG
ncbi:MAG: lipid-A-disaccharide synthase [Pseudomonadota bacterium]